MNYTLEWQQLSYLYWLIPAIFLLCWLRLKMYRPVRYRFTLVQQFFQNNIQTKHIYASFFFLLRLLTLSTLALLIAQPRLVDMDSRVPVEGIDIMMVLDISGSMRFQDEVGDPRTRLDVAKQEAIRFVDKRDNDAIGLALFANDALSRVPLTMDKQLLKKVISELYLGFINPDGTLLFTGVLTAANRLKHSKAKSKIMILLTDGEPTDGDMSPQVVTEILKQLGIKVYAIGVGNDKPAYVHTQMGMALIPGINRDVLESIAHETGGKFFLAKKPNDMRAIYDTINALETSEQEVPIFSKWYDIAFSVIWFILALLIIELGIATFVWFSL